MDGFRMILNNQTQQHAMNAFRQSTPLRTGNLRFNAVKLIPIVNYDKFLIYVDAKIAHYGHILEVAEKIKYYVGPRKINGVVIPKEQRRFIYKPNKHYHWITERAVPNTAQQIATILDGKVIY